MSGEGRLDDGTQGARGLRADVPALRERQGAAGRPYLEFLRVPAMSAGLYVLAAGAEDRQQPHAEDELYVVTAGVARFELNGQAQDVSAGAVLYVPAGMQHRFFDIRAELRTLVIFAPPENAPGT
jgi:quercetin dioxygenase-like cupin family protein